MGNKTKKKITSKQLKSIITNAESKSGFQVSKMQNISELPEKIKKSKLDDHTKKGLAVVYSKKTEISITEPIPPISTYLSYMSALCNKQVITADSANSHLNSADKFAKEFKHSEAPSYNITSDTNEIKKIISKLEEYKKKLDDQKENGNETEAKYSKGTSESINNMNKSYNQLLEWTSKYMQIYSSLIRYKTEVKNSIKKLKSS